MQWMGNGVCVLVTGRWAVSDLSTPTPVAALNNPFALPLCCAGCAGCRAVCPSLCPFASLLCWLLAGWLAAGWLAVLLAGLLCW